METIILENFRCFAGRHEVPLRPLTLLVGENSTGKTSFLAGCMHAHRLGTFVGTPDFNTAPFLLGTFQGISNNRVLTAAVPPAFKLGLQAKAYGLECTVEAEGAQPRLSNWSIRSASGDTIIASRHGDGPWTVEIPGLGELVFGAGVSFIYSKQLFSSVLLSTLSKKGVADSALKHGWQSVAEAVASSQIFAGAPIRAEPRRTFELTSDQPNPQGNHVPVTLSQIYGSDEWEEVERPILAFSKEAGLFERISVKKRGSGEGGSFQIHVSLSRRDRNIIDVGYGVSQVLPVAFDAVRGPDRRIYLFQQPEVHLHPRAQAELATLFGSLVKAHKKQFLIETHSDFLIDRVRMDVRDGKNLRPEDVVILYFEKGKNGVMIHPIYLDDRANLLDVPDSYRQFFLDEERRFLGVF